MPDELKIVTVSTERTVLLRQGKKSYRAKFFGRDASAATLSFYSRANHSWRYLDEKGPVGVRVVAALVRLLADEPELLDTVKPREVSCAAG